MQDSMIAYCGPAAVPDDLWTRWNVDPLLIPALAALALAVGRSRSSDTRAGWAAIVLMLVIFVSPLCALSSALFSVRVLHHVLLIAAVAPLLAWLFRNGARARQSLCLSRHMQSSSGYGMHPHLQ
jgi:putative membrane protein